MTTGGDLGRHRHDEFREYVAVFGAVALEVDQRPTAGRRLVEFQNVDGRAVVEGLDSRKFRARTTTKLEVGAHADDIPSERHGRDRSAPRKLVLDYANQLRPDG